MRFPKAKKQASPVVLILLVVLTWACPAVAPHAAVAGDGGVIEDARQAMFERVFGQAARLDPAIVAKVKSLPPGKRLLVDRDGDGKNDEVWYIDTAVRHTIRPILVRVIDEDGDLDRHKGPDLDSDLYLADWKADGTIDVAVDYQDNDGDGDVDEMGTYFWSSRSPVAGKGMLRVWWGRDDGDDNLLWYNVNWNYYQGLCQYRCHFGGEETFVAFALLADADRWISHYENPFAFYDPDGDGCSEVVVRISGLNDQVNSLRYSFDADGDAHGRRAHDYEFSITAIPEEIPASPGKPAASALRLSDDVSFTTKLRGIPIHRTLRSDAAEQFARQAPWAKACLTWDEINANSEQNAKRDPHERWEGIIVHKSEHFPQIGGPPTSELNKRNEIAAPATPLRLYYDPTDHRLHLLGAGAAEGWIKVDYDLDGKMDARYTYLDDNRDGVFDRRQIDLDGDGRVEFDWKMKGEPADQIELRYGPLSEFYKRELAAVLAQSQRFVDAAKAVLPEGAAGAEAVETFFLTRLALWCPSTRLGQRIRSTPAGARYYVDLIRDQLLGALKRKFGKHPAWGQLETTYAAGNYAAAAELVLGRLGPAAKLAAAEKFESFTRRLPIRIDNRGGPQRDQWPVVLSVERLRTAAGDFNPDCCAAVGPNRWIDWLEIPHQLDRIDASVGNEISFLADLSADAQATYYLYYSPTGKRDKAFDRMTGTCNSWKPPAEMNIGWDSDLGAYRSYDGHFDFFGKQTYQHSKRVRWLIYPVTSSYHTEQAWGMDALHVGDTSGLGGLTLYLGDREQIVRNPNCKGPIKFTERMLTSGPIRAAVEITAENVVPDRPDLAVRFLCIIYAGHQESEIRVTVSGAGGSLLMAPGLTKLPREQHFFDNSAGCLGSWGWQEDVIGEVGLGLIVPPERLKNMVELAGQRRLRCQCPDATLRYWIIGDWRRGRRFPIAPTISYWKREL